MQNWMKLRVLCILLVKEKWTVETALDLQTATPVIAMSLLMRYRSLDNDTFTGKVVAALRNEFGGHAVERNKVKL